MRTIQDEKKKHMNDNHATFHTAEFSHTNYSFINC